MRKPLVQNAGIIKTIFVMAFCHFSVTFLCINVMFDLLFIGLPLFIIHLTGIMSNKNFYRLTTSLINWTTPIVYGFPMVFSGTEVFVDNIDILLSSKRSDSLLLSNHGSRIDWMVAMLVGHLENAGNHRTVVCRVGFVCEAIIQFMPFIGWYRKLVCNDIFVSRSFVKDEMKIKNNIQEFHQQSESRMLFLSPEGVIVDHGEKDVMYIHACRDFAITNAVQPFDYVLTPRYKGTHCLLDQVKGNRGPIISVCLVFVRDGKLLNCKLLSPDRVVPDIYDLNQGIAGSPISIYIHLRTIEFDEGKSAFDAKAVLFAEYAWKDSVLHEWESRLQLQESSSKNTRQQQYDKENRNSNNKGPCFTKLESLRMSIVLNHIFHAVFIMTVSVTCGCTIFITKTCMAMFWCLAVTHTIGWLVNQSSMESVPFETGIKAAIAFLSSFWINGRFTIKSRRE